MEKEEFAYVDEILKSVHKNITEVILKLNSNGKADM